MSSRKRLYSILSLMAYNKPMQFLRKTALVLVASSFVFLLFGFGVFWGIERVFGTPDALKSSLRDSGIYNSIVGDALEKAQKDEGQQGTSDEIPISRPEVRKIITDAFPPSFMQTQTEGLLDSTYNWLQGDTKTLVFKLDLTDSKTRLANGVHDYVAARLASLPVCTANDLKLAAGSDVDPFNAPCVPTGFDINAAAEKSRQEILAGEFMKDTEITAADLETSDGKSFEQQYKKAPAAYRNIVSAVYAMGVIAVLMGVGVVFLSVTKRAGLKRIAILGLSAGGFLVIISWLFGVALKRVTEEVTKSSHGSEPLQQKLMDVMQNLGGDVRAWWLWFGLIVVAAAAGGLIALHFTKPKDEELAAAIATTPPNDPGGEAPLPTEHIDANKPDTHKNKKRR